MPKNSNLNDLSFLMANNKYLNKPFKIFASFHKDHKHVSCPKMTYFNITIFF